MYSNSRALIVRGERLHSVFDVIDMIFPHLDLQERRKRWHALVCNDTYYQRGNKKIQLARFRKHYRLEPMAKPEILYIMAGRLTKDPRFVKYLVSSWNLPSIDFLRTLSAARATGQPSQAMYRPYCPRDTEFIEPLRICWNIEYCVYCIEPFKKECGECKRPSCEACLHKCIHCGLDVCSNHINEYQVCVRSSRKEAAIQRNRYAALEISLMTPTGRFDLFARRLNVDIEYIMELRRELECEVRNQEARIKEMLTRKKKKQAKRLKKKIRCSQYQECVVCLDAQATVTFMPCGHKVCCTQCYDIFTKQECCYCRACIETCVN